MNLKLIMVLGLLALCVAMFIWNRPRMDVVALIALVALPLMGVVSAEEALAGFSDPAVILIAGFFVVGGALVRTGIASRIGEFLLARAGQSEGRMVAVLMLAVAALGSLMSSMGVVPIFIPAALEMAHRQKVHPGKLMMPLSIAALISGMLTLVATAPNLVADSALRRAGFAGFGFFTFTPFGIVILLAGIGYMLVARRWLHPHDEGKGAAEARRRNLMDLVRDYKLAGREHRLKIGARSPLAGQTLQQIGTRRQGEATVVMIERSKGSRRHFLEPHGDMALMEGDVLMVDFPAPVDEGLQKRLEELKLDRLPLRGRYFTDQSGEIGMAEVMLPPDSSLVGKSVIENGFRTRTRLNVIGLRRNREAIEAGITNEKLRTGDVLLVIGRWKHVRELQTQTSDFVVLSLPVEIDQVAPAQPRAPYALACLAIMITLMVSGWVPNPLAAIIGCLLMGLTRCITLDSAYRSIHFPSLVLIVGMMPFSIALKNTGGVDLAADALVQMFGQAQPRILFAGLFTLTALVGLFISNTATAVLMAPIALTLAQTMHHAPHPYMMTVALASSAAFMTPVSSPVNTLVVAPGHYRFGDFVKIGVPFTVIMMILTVILVPWLLPLRP